MGLHLNPIFGNLSSPFSGFRIAHSQKLMIRDLLANNFRKLREATPSLNSPKDIVKAQAATNGTIGRIAKRETGVSIDKLEPLAEAYGLEVWQMLTPSLQATRGIGGKPIISGIPEWPFELISPTQYKQLDPEFRRHIENDLAGEWLRVQSKSGTNN